MKSETEPRNIPEEEKELKQNNMKREIKFRGISKETGKMVFGSLVNNLWTKSELTENPGEPVLEIVTTENDCDCWEDLESSGNVVEIIPESCGQYTGLTDKNGKEIFEGDIVRMNWLAEKDNEELLEAIESKKEAGLFENHDQYFYEKEQAKILSIDELITPIIFENGMFQGIRPGDQRILFYHKIKEWDVEIIGNVFETPELLTTNNIK